MGLRGSGGCEWNVLFLTWVSVWAYDCAGISRIIFRSRTVSWDILTHGMMIADFC